MNPYLKQSIWQGLILLLADVSFLIISPAHVTAESQIRFAAIGDYGSGNQNERDVANMINGWNVDFVITAGDNRYGDTTYDQVVGQFYCDFLKDVVPGIYCPGGTSTTNAFFPSLGNHDYSDGRGIGEYLDYFTLPGSDFTNSSNKKRYYDFVWEPVHFFVINSNSQEPDGTGSSSDQALWLKNQLAESTTPWQIVYFHHAPYSSGNKHGSTAFMQWPFAAWGADVVIAGHDHTYERIIRDGIVYFVNGLGGDDKYACGSPVTGSQICYDDDYGAMLIGASESNVNFQFINLAGTVVDNYIYDGLIFTPVEPCRIVDTRKSGGIVGAFTQRNFRVFGSGGTIGAQGGNPAGCTSPLGQPLAAHINMVAVNPTGKGNLQAFPVGAGTGAGLSVNYNTIDTNLANAGTVKTVTGSGADITVASNFSSAHTAIDVLGYYYSNGNLFYTAVAPCRIVDTRKTSAGIIDASTQRNFRVFGSGGTMSAQGGNPAGCSSPLGQPLAAHINMVAVNPTGRGNLQAFPVGAGTGAGLSVNYNTIDTNLANAGTVKTVTGAGADITVASNFSSAHTVIDILGYYYPDGDLLYKAVTPCRIVDTRKTSTGIIDASTQRNFRVFGSGGAINAQGGNAAGCPSPLGQPLAAHINMAAVNPTGKGNLQAFPVGAGTGAGLSVNYNTIDTNLANAGIVKTVTGAGADITVASNFSSAHTAIDVLGYYYPAP